MHPPENLGACILRQVCKKLYKTFDEVTASDQDIEGNIRPQRPPGLMETLAGGDGMASQDLKRLHTQGVCSHAEEDTVERWSHLRVAQELEHAAHSSWSCVWGMEDV